MWKLITACILIFLLILSCRRDLTGVENSIDQISLSTDKFSYTVSDSINIYLENRSGFDIITGLRCGAYLEMFYQKKENNVWSDNLWFWYMSLKCATLPDTIPSNNTFTHSKPSKIFESTGTFRLLVEVYLPERNASKTIISNSFEIEE